MSTPDIRSPEPTINPTVVAGVLAASNSAENHHEAGDCLAENLPADWPTWCPIPGEWLSNTDRSTWAATIAAELDGSAGRARAKKVAEMMAEREANRPEPKAKVREPYFVPPTEDHPLNVEAAEAYLQQCRSWMEFAGGLGYLNCFKAYMLGVSVDTGTRLAVKVAGDAAAPEFEAEVRALFERAADEYDLDFNGSRGKHVSAEVRDAWCKLGSSVAAIAPDDLSRFAGRWPDEYEALPALEFHDDDKTLPNFPDGALGILYGQWGSHKTNLTLTKMLDAAGKGVRVLYAAGEGAYGVGRDRVPAHCQSRGIATAELRGRFLIAPAVPLFKSVEQVEAFIAAHNAYRPQIVVIDTLATATAGEDENSSQVGAMLTDNGAAGYIKRAWNCLVLIVAHQGKDKSKGVRGHSGLMANVDFLLETDADKDRHVIKLHVEKMRDAPDGFDVYYRYEPTGVPVPVKISPSEYAKLTAQAAPTEETLPVGLRVTSFLRLNGHHTWQGGIETPALAAALTEQELGPRPGETGEPGVADWDTARVDWRKALGNAKRTSAWAKACTAERIQDGGEKEILRWFSGPPREDEPEF
jgi:hypothetical protein